jgi:hypothetical protein
LYLETGTIIGSRLEIVIALPKKATEGKSVRLRVEGVVIRVEKPSKAGRKQGIAVRFTNDYSFEGAPPKP